jgi:hypothetical protein
MRLNAWRRPAAITIATIALGILTSACGDDGSGGGTKKAFCRTANNLADNVPEGAVEGTIFGEAFVTYPRADLKNLANDAPSELSDAFSKIENGKSNARAERQINNYLNQQCGTPSLLIVRGMLVQLT